MKSQIDNIAREIENNLKESKSVDPQVNLILNITRVKGISRAVDLRAVLENWTKDLNITDDVRKYAEERLNALSLF